MTSQFTKYKDATLKRIHARRMHEYIIKNTPILVYFLCLMRANLTRITSPANSTSRRLPSYPVFTLLLHFLFIFYLSRYTLPNFSYVSSLASLPFLSCCHQTTTTILFKMNKYFIKTRKNLSKPRSKKLFMSVK